MPIAQRGLLQRTIRRNGSTVVLSVFSVFSIFPLFVMHHPSFPPSIPRRRRRHWDDSPPFLVVTAAGTAVPPSISRHRRRRDTPSIPMSPQPPGRLPPLPSCCPSDTFLHPCAPMPDILPPFQVSVAFYQLNEYVSFLCLTHKHGC
jgi:hypothetical protein